MQREELGGLLMLEKELLGGMLMLERELLGGMLMLEVELLGGDVDAGFSPIEDGGASLIDDDDGPIPQSFSSAPLACCLGIPLGDEEAFSIF